MMRLSLSCLFMTVAISSLTWADTEVNEPSPISDKDASVIATTVLCQNLPVAESDKRLEAYARYFDQVSELLGRNADSIQSDVVGISHNHQMRYQLKSSVTIVGIPFDTVSMVAVKDPNANYYQIVASKPFLEADKGLLQNIPANDNLTVSTQDDTLSLVCNVKLLQQAK